ncbi:MAG: hypothetical protein JWS10_670 [Cypionkella sp.]|uniref:hypothetical protein n=1 Tax=Cypionkella sp. TaxID=2811411 RepID=UPI002627F45B|nr:hypothetical protein [Cypionkella sp.]MDB5658055.1 hypothetical protein [Cypionkella sp.]
MSTIIVYKRTGNTMFALDAAERQNGMVDAGKKLRTALSASGGSVNDDDAEDRVRNVLDFLIAEKVPLSTTQHLYDVRLEKSRISTVSYKLAGATDKRQRYILTHRDNLIVGDPNNAPKPDGLLTDADRAKNGKLKLDVGLDNLATANNVFKMRMTVPRAASDSNSWGYLSTDIYSDEKILESGVVTPPLPAAIAEKIEGYLISTFTFSRCR